MRGVSDDTVRETRRLFGLYGPAVFGAAMMGVGAARLLGVVTIRVDGLLVVTGAMLAVLALHRAHEYAHGLSDWGTPMWPSTAYALSVALFAVALRFDAVIPAVVGGVVAVGTAYVRSRHD